MVRVVGAWDFLLIVVILIIFLLSSLLLLLHIHLLLLGGLGFLCLCLVVVHVDINLIFFLLRVNLLAIVNINCKIKRLVVHLRAFNIGWFGLGAGAGGLCRRGNVLLHWLAHGIAGSRWHFISLLLAIEIVAELQCFAALLGELVFVTIHISFFFQI